MFQICKEYILFQLNYRIQKQFMLLLFYLDWPGTIDDTNLDTYIFNVYFCFEIAGLALSVIFVDLSYFLAVYKYISYCIVIANELIIDIKCYVR